MIDERFREGCNVFSWERGKSKGYQGGKRITCVQYGKKESIYDPVKAQRSSSREEDQSIQAVNWGTLSILHKFGEATIAEP